MKKPIAVGIALVLMIIAFSGCGTKAALKRAKRETSVLKAGIVAENTDYRLTWNDELNCILFENVKTGKIWSSIPYDSVISGQKNTTLNVRVQNSASLLEESYGDSSTENVKIYSKKIKNGVQLNYYFDTIGLAIPVAYTLRSDSLEVSVDTSLIEETNKSYSVVAIEPSPLMCSAKNGKENSYFFVPAGSGAIINNVISANGARASSGSSANRASLSFESYVNNPEHAELGVYGVKDEDCALLGIEEKNATAIGVGYSVGDKRNDYSYVFPSIKVRDFDFITSVTGKESIAKVSELPHTVVSFAYYPLSGAEADYNGMARCYRNYLKNKGLIDENSLLKSDPTPYSVTFLGGIMTKESAMGIPYRKLSLLTKFGKAEKITKELCDATGKAPIVRLSGFGESGISTGKIAGGYEFSKVFGSEKDRMSFEAYCKNNSISLFIEFDLMRYSKSGVGFSYKTDPAKTAIKHAAEISPVKVPLRDKDSDKTFRLLGRANLFKATEKLLKFAQKSGISAISFNTLGNWSYSDYSDADRYGITNHMAEDARGYIAKVRKAGYPVAVSCAADYAAGSSDVIFDAPTEPTASMKFDLEIPFYEMVFHAEKPIYSSAINTSSDFKRKIMYSAIAGTGLSFTLIDHFETYYMQNTTEKLYGMLCKDNIDLIEQTVKKYSDTYSRVCRAHIESYEMVDENISKTTFENGVVLYANHSSKAAKMPNGSVLESYDYCMEGGTGK